MLKSFEQQRQWLKTVVATALCRCVDARQSGATSGCCNRGRWPRWTRKSANARDVAGKPRRL